MGIVARVDAAVCDEVVARSEVVRTPTTLEGVRNVCSCTK